MTNYGKRHGLTRLAPMLGGSLVVVGCLYFISDSDNEVVATSEATATVIAVHESKSDSGIGLVEVRLADGGRAKFFLSKPLPAPKARIKVTVADYADGKREITAPGYDSPQ
jgi:hypothetical protein